MLTYIVLAIVALSSVWVAFDAHRNRVGSSIGWLIGCLLLWIVAFPIYLFSRAKALRERPGESVNSRAVSALGFLCILSVAACVAAPFLGWQERLSVDDLRDQVLKSVQDTWSEQAATRHIHVKNLVLVHRAGNEYTGVLTTAPDDNLGRDAQYTVEVTYDGKTFVWRIQ